jgi:hypothetical protein
MAATRAHRVPFEDLPLTNCHSVVRPVHRSYLGAWRAAAEGSAERERAALAINEWIADAMYFYGIQRRPTIRRPEFDGLPVTNDFYRRVGCCKLLRRHAADGGKCRRSRTLGRRIQQRRLQKQLWARSHAPRSRLSSACEKANGELVPEFQGSQFTAAKSLMSTSSWHSAENSLHSENDSEFVDVESATSSSSSSSVSSSSESSDRFEAIARVMKLNNYSSLQSMRSVRSRANSVDADVVTTFVESVERVATARRVLESSAAGATLTPLQCLMQKR